MSRRTLDVIVGDMKNFGGGCVRFGTAMLHGAVAPYLLTTGLRVLRSKANQQFSEDSPSLTYPLGFGAGAIVGITGPAVYYVTNNSVKEYLLAAAAINVVDYLTRQRAISSQ